MSIVNHIIKEFLPQLENAEKKDLLEALVVMIDRELVSELYEDEPEDVVCPRCGCAHTIKKGKSCSGRQKYRCKSCNRYFTNATRRVLSLSKLKREVWVEYVKEMIGEASLRDAMLAVGVSLKTAFFMRHRICECMQGFLDEFRCGKNCSAEIDEYYIAESFKGNHRKNADFEMPRDSRRRGSDNKKRGISSDQIGILTAINDRGSVLAVAACRGHLGKQEAKDILEGKILEGAIVSTDKHPSYKKLIGELGAAVHNRFDSKDRSEGVINAVNSLHARLDTFVRRFKGISSRRLSNYLTWFCWIESFKALRKGSDWKNLMVKHIVNGFYETRIRDYPQTPYPFGEYWGLA